MLLQITQGGIGVTMVLIAYNNADRFKIRIERDVLPTILAHPTWKFQIVVVDNSSEDKRPSIDIFSTYSLDYVYKWTGTNLMYGPSMNLASQFSKYPYLVYVCSNHGHMYDPTWIDDLIVPIVKNSKVAMTGSHYASCKPVVLGFPPNLPPIHIQGGVFGAKTENLLAHPYTNDERYIHWGSDIYECFQLLNAGFVLYNVSTINSVWKRHVKWPERWKYVHDESEL